MKKNLLETDNVYEKNTCNHLNTIVDRNAGEQFCGDCGAVLVENMVDFSAELRTEDFKNSRTGPKNSLKMLDRGLSTEIGKFNVDSTGKALSYEMKNSLKRMRLWDSRSKGNSAGRRNLRTALIEINKLAEKMSLSDAILERSAYFYRKASEKKLIQGRSIRSVVGACIYAACRDLGTNRTIIEISRFLPEDRRSIAKTYRVLFQQLNFNFSITDSTNSIIRFSNNLGISEKTKRDAILIFDLLKEKEITAGKKPDAVAATVVYMACIKNKEDFSQHKIAKVSGITKVTIRNRYQEFKKFVKLV